ncbi:MFS transporter [Cuniculiplasma divulgatum]|uniref:DHA2 family major facilitator superfamily permease n=1 Tax=Cuniculiplasma divulgatum TaxID=1673428 RepID=A0A1N5WGF0_9ARCH|nr:MFS transporter [Cuniculiplasma divulgatum]SIM84156.1 DHA2 family major facilitator superfamily permease [Cuniculiplasma divulgatum]
MNGKDIVVASLLGFISTFEATMILVAVPVLSDYFGISHLQASLLVTIYVAIEAFLFVPFAMIFERISLKLGMIFGGALLAAGGFLIFFSSSFIEIEFFRMIQAVGASIVLPTSLAYASSIGDDASRGSAIGTNHTIVSLGYVIGLPVGGFVALLDWKVLFLVSSLLALVCLAFALRIEDIRKASSIGRRAFGPSLALSGVVLLALNIWAGIAVMAIGLIMSSRVRLPREYVKSSLSGFLHSITRNSFAAYLVFLYAYLGYNSLQYGLLILLFPLSFTFFSLAGGKASDRFGRKVVPMLAFLTMALFSFSIFINLILAEILLGIASGLATTSNTSYTMNSLGQENRIVGSALRTLQGTVAMSIGLSIGSFISIGSKDIVLILLALNVVAATLVLSYKFPMSKEVCLHIL